MNPKWRLAVSLFFLFLAVVMLYWGVRPPAHEVLTQPLPVVIP